MNKKLNIIILAILIALAISYAQFYSIKEGIESITGLVVSNENNHQNSNSIIASKIMNNKLILNETIIVTLNETVIIVLEEKGIINKTAEKAETNRSKVVINKPVKWLKNVKLGEVKNNLSVNITLEATNITVRKIEDDIAQEISEDRVRVRDKGKIKGLVEYETEKEAEKLENGLEQEKSNLITGNIILENTQDVVENSTEIIIEYPLEEVEVEYYTEGPISEETALAENRKQIIISSDIHYEDILSYTFLPTEAAPEAVKLYWIVNNTKIEVSADKYDTNNNSLTDYIEWNVPSLSSQAYELIIEISKAEHLDENRGFIADIYDYVKAKDNNWTYAINTSEYLRVTFEQALDNTKDITLYARGNGSILVYEYEGNETIAFFDGINEEKEYKAYLTGLIGTQDTFDLRVVGSVEFDYIVDPSGVLPIWDDSKTTTVYVNYTKFYANYTDDSGISINGTGSWCQLSYNKTGRYTPFINMTFNPSTLLYELTANGSYEEMVESEERWILTNGSMPTVPYGNYSFNISCYNSTDTISAVANISVSLHQTGLDSFDRENDTETNALSNDIQVRSGEMTSFYANYTLANGDMLKRQILNKYTESGVDPYAIEVGDIDNDGIIEIVVGDDDGDLAVYNSTGGQERAFMGIPGASGTIWDIEISDLDNDGNKEVIFVDSGSSRLFITNSSLNLTSNLTTVQTPYTVKVGDINNDGYKEIIVGTATGTNETQVYNYTSASKLSRKWNYDFLGTTANVWYNGISLYDIDNNGVLDVIAGSDNDTIAAFYGNGTKIWEANAADDIDAIKAADINNDGLIEIVAGDDDGDIGIWNSTGGQINALTAITGAASDIWNIEISDLDNNGKTEIVFIDTSSDLLIIVNSSLNLLNSTDLGTADPYTMEIADINNDGYKEIVVGTFSGTNELQVYNYSANATTGKLNNIWNYDFAGDIDYHAIDLYDIDNNGIPDIIAGSEDQKILATKLSGCSVWFNDSSSWNGMLSNSSAGLYQYNRSFGTGGDYAWNVTCSKDYYQTKAFSGENLTIISPPSDKYNISP